MKTVSRTRKSRQGRQSYPEIQEIVSAARENVSKDTPVELEKSDFPKAAQDDPAAMNRFLTSLGNRIRDEKDLKMRMPQAENGDPAAVKVQRKTYAKGKSPKTETISVAVEIHAA